jgi:RNA polymerase-interacting CarD/CdnL/TRCF family regulator
MFEPGQRVVIKGRCLGTVVAVGDSILVDELDLKPGEECRFEIPGDRVAEAIRPIVSRDVGERVLAIAKERAARPATDERTLAYRRAYKSGDLEVQARLLAASYNGPQEAPEVQYQERLEHSVFGELAVVLGTSRKALRAQVRQAALSEAPSRALALPDVSQELAAVVVPTLPGFEPIGAFAVHERIAVGEYRAECAVPARPGIWLAYASRLDDDFDRVFAIHRDHLAELRDLERQARAIGRSSIEGAHIAIFDEALADDAELFTAIGEAGLAILEHRCAAIGLGGDGVARVLAAPRDCAVYVRLEL